MSYRRKPKTGCSGATPAVPRNQPHARNLASTPSAGASLTARVRSDGQEQAMLSQLSDHPPLIGSFPRLAQLFPRRAKLLPCLMPESGFSRSKLHLASRHVCHALCLDLKTHRAVSDRNSDRVTRKGHTEKNALAHATVTRIGKTVLRM